MERTGIAQRVRTGLKAELIRALEDSRQHGARATGRLQMSPTRTPHAQLHALTHAQGDLAGARYSSLHRVLLEHLGACSLDYSRSILASELSDASLLDWHPKSSVDIGHLQQLCNLPYLSPAAEQLLTAVLVDTGNGESSSSCHAPTGRSVLLRLIDALSQHLRTQRFDTATQTQSADWAQSSLESRLAAISVRHAGSEEEQQTHRDVSIEQRLLQVEAAAEQRAEERLQARMERFRHAEVARIKTQARVDMK